MNIFIVFANQDRDVCDRLLRQMNLVKDRHGWSIWSAKEIKAGDRWGDEIERWLQDSEVVILLLSTDFFNSPYIIETELPEVIKKHRQGNCHIIPIVARDCLWKETRFGEYAELGDIQALPVGERPIVSRSKWDSDDQPYSETVQGIRDSIKSFQAKKQAERAAEAQRAKEAEIAHQREAQLKREREEQARRERADEAQRAKEAEIAHQREAQLKREREEQARREQEAEAQRADEAEIAHQRKVQLKREREERVEQEAEVRYPTKELKRRYVNLISLKQYVTISSGILALLLTVWLIFGGNDKQNAQNPSPEQDSPLFEKSSPPKLGLEMVRVEGGTFIMGSPLNETSRSDHECQHTVTIRSFSIGKYEITQAIYREIMGSNPSDFKGCDDCPVERVSWNHIQDFLKRLNARYPGKNYRLPNEEEWEYAARGGNISNDAYFSHSGSNNLNAIAWYKDNSNLKTHPVGLKSPNQLGLYDMTGNVWEWCQDDYKTYPNCEGQPSGLAKIVRGGGWKTDEDSCRVAFRYYRGPGYRYNSLGFRLACN